MVHIRYKNTLGPQFDAVLELELVVVGLVDVGVGGDVVELFLEPVGQLGVGPDNGGEGTAQRILEAELRFGKCKK